MNVSSLRGTSAAFTDAGAVREVNEDSCLELAGKGIWVVADGMGGHANGQLASRLICDRISRVGQAACSVDLVDEVEDCLMAVNRELFELGADSGDQWTVGSTVVALVALNRHAVLLWAGDSRAYRFRSGLLRQITRDHSEVQGLIDEGLVDPLDREEHPKANVITRAIGGEPEIVVDAEICSIRSGDRFLLCTDGLYRELSLEEMADRMAVQSLDRAVRELERVVAEQRCADNVTAVVIDFQRS